MLFSHNYPISPALYALPLCLQVQLQAKTNIAKSVLGPEWVIIYEGPATATTFPELQPGCAYLVRVAAVNGVGRGPFSMHMQVLTASGVPLKPPPPEADVDSMVSIMQKCMKV